MGLLAADSGHGVVRGQGRFAEADGDQGDLAVIAGDVAGGVDARQIGLHLRRHLDLLLVLELQAPLGDRSQVGDEAELEDRRVDGDPRALLGGGVLDLESFESTAAEGVAHFAGRVDHHLALLGEPSHFVDRRLEAAELGAAVDQVDRQLAGVLQVHRPVERRAPAAQDRHPQPAVDRLLLDEVAHAADVLPLDTEVGNAAAAGAHRQQDDPQRRHHLPAR